MSVEIFINPDAKGYEQVQRGLREELGAIKQIKVTEVPSAAPPKTLSIEHDIFKFVIEHPSTILLAKAAIELIRSIVDRSRLSIDRKQPPTVIVVGDKKLAVPSSPQTEARFLQRLASKSSDKDAKPKPSEAKRTPSKSKASTKKKTERSKTKPSRSSISLNSKRSVKGT